MEELGLFFPQLSDRQRQQFAALGELYRMWNDRINVISRKDIGNLYVRHVLHSLAIARVVRFEPGSVVLDLGTGGGFPGIPLAVLYDDVRFVLADSIGKKLKVAEAVSAGIGLTNVRTYHGRAETLPERHFAYVVSRAVTTLPRILQWTDARMIPASPAHPDYGLYYLKGGDLTEELSVLKKRHIRLTDVRSVIDHPFFEDKKIVYVASHGSV